MKETTLETARIMASVERRLNSLLDKSVSHCGHEELMEEMRRSYERFIRFVEGEVEKLARKAGEV